MRHDYIVVTPAATTCAEQPGGEPARLRLIPASLGGRPIAFDHVPTPRVASEVGVSRDPESQATTVAVPSPLQGTVVKVGVTPGQEIAAGGMLVIIESMKMEHVVAASRGGTIAAVSV